VSSIFERGIYSLNCERRVSKELWLTTERTLDSARLGSYYSCPKVPRPLCGSYILLLNNNRLNTVIITRPTAADAPASRRRRGWRTESSLDGCGLVLFLPEGPCLQKGLESKLLEIFLTSISWRERLFQGRAFPWEAALCT
jgi:hypothetical protein